ncbi:glycerophosphodiester phosphodiesterase [Roseateles oligotrophus]|uniref:Glycerophosphodiester phosphodiesterase n=1 Tax=Roseateles oligotrophus TaxID=1769250 RepID=A0ABT2YJ76_9BURK|nr:glycerophosphodiester phosphodiesterase [Roseateles oligotrophus]MCV2370078.1 glycerophosphodiester phosphodiesterase [Roseateles oligotrophus]
MNSKAWPLPFWIAHRGAGKLAPENTLAAFRLGAQYGYRAFECDVKLSSDGLPFLLHDATLERTSNGQGVAGALSWSELSRLDAGGWHSRSFAGEPLPSLIAVARFVIGNRYALNIEIKPTPGQELLTGQVVGREVLRLWQGSGLAPLFSSFDPLALQGALESAPAIPRGLLLDSLREGWLAEAQALACRAVITNYRLMDAATIAKIHAAGMQALVYTVNDAATAQTLIGDGVDGIITDAVDRFSPV